MVVLVRIPRVAGLRQLLIVVRHAHLIGECVGSCNGASLVLLYRRLMLLIEVLADLAQVRLGCYITLGQLQRPFQR